MKKILNFTLVLLLLGAVLSPMVYASDMEETEVIETVQKIVDEANEEINDEISTAQKEGSMLLEQLNEGYLSEEEFEGELDELIEELVNETNEIANETVEEAAEYGVTVKCELISVEIGGREVLIDPLRIIGS